MSALHSIPTSQLPHQEPHHALTSNLATVAVGSAHTKTPNQDYYTPAPSAALKPAIASVPEATTHWLSGVFADHQLSKDMAEHPMELDSAIRESVESALAHTFAGQAEMYTPAHERMAIANEVMTQARHFRETLKANSHSLTIENLKNMIGPHSVLSHQHRERIAKHHPDHPHNKMQAQQVAANDAYYAHNAHAHPTHHSLSGVEHHGTVHELQHLVGTATH